ncbi:MAG: DUF6261 family protein, partial [Tannerellaceae bacterium]|nr:DUF6261 family protein [Tannerellaceae bacterium]
YTLLHIQKWLDALETANHEFYTLSKQRTNEQATLISGESKAKRQEADKAYKTLVEMINAFALTADNPQVFKETIQNVNRLIDYENAVMKARDTRNKQKKCLLRRRRNRIKRQ